MMFLSFLKLDGLLWINLGQMFSIMVVLFAGDSIYPKKSFQKNVGDLCDSYTSLKKNPCSSPWGLKHRQWVNGQLLQDASLQDVGTLYLLFAISIWQVKFRGIPPATALFLPHSCFPVPSMDLFVSFPRLSRLFYRRLLANNHRTELPQNRPCLSCLTWRFLMPWLFLS